MTLCVRLFGKFCALYNREQVPLPIHAGKVQELFCYLLLYRERSHAREGLASALWGDNPTAQAKKSLRQGLWQLQGTLDAAPDRELATLLAVDAEYVQLSVQDCVWLDIAQFEEAYFKSQGIRGRELEPTTADDLKKAVGLYRGDLLEGWYQEWCLFERERLQNAYMLMLDKLMGYCEAHREFEQGLVYGDVILRLDRASEKTHQRLMRLYYATGNRARALRQYAHCTAALQEELGVNPSAATNELYQQLCADQCETAMAASNAALAASPALVTLLERFRQIQTSLAQVQQQVHQEIQLIERALNPPPRR